MSHDPEILDMEERYNDWKERQLQERSARMEAGHAHREGYGRKADRYQQEEEGADDLGALPLSDEEQADQIPLEALGEGRRVLR